MDVHESVPRVLLPAITRATASDEHVPADRLRSWMKAASGGDASAFTRVFVACRWWVLARCRQNLPAADAEDACAEVFAKTWQHVRSGRVIAHPLAWLATCTRHAICDHHRRAKRVTSAPELPDDVDPAPGPCDLAASHAITPIVAAWHDSLRQAERAAVDGYLAGQHPTTTSKKRGYTPAALVSGLYRARQRLRRDLTARGLSCPTPLRIRRPPPDSRAHGAVSPSDAPHPTTPTASASG